MRRDCPECGDPLALKAISCRCGWGGKSGAQLSPEAARARFDDYARRKALSEAGVNADRRSTSPWVQVVREEYLKSPAGRLGEKPMAKHIEREPGSDDE